MSGAPEGRDPIDLAEDWLHADEDGRASARETFAVIHALRKEVLRLRSESEGERLAELAATTGRVLDIRVYPYRRVYAWWHDDEDNAAEGNGATAFADAIAVLHPEGSPEPREASDG